MQGNADVLYTISVARPTRTQGLVGTGRESVVPVTSHHPTGFSPDQIIVGPADINGWAVCCRDCRRGRYGTG